MIKIYYHIKDFGLEVVSYNFFSKSHGKNACDGVDAAAKKKIARRASIQQTTSNHFSIQHKCTIIEAKLL